MSDTAPETDTPNKKDPQAKADPKGAASENSPPKKTASDGNARKVSIGDFVILTDKPLKRFDRGEVKAYKVTHKKASETFFAMVSEPHLVPRHNKVSTYESIINPHLVKIVQKGAVYWPPAGQERYIIIYHDNLGERLIDPDKEQALGLKNDVVHEKILKPFAGILQDFRDKDFFHGGMCASNLYSGGSSNLSKVVLGDGLMMPSGYSQNVAYEPLERAMADPIARGPGTSITDLYSFGVLLATLLRQHDPMKGFTENQIIRKKIDVGSYAAVTGKDRFTGPILELLRGLLHDDPTQRWTIDEMLVWIDGRRLSPKQSSRKLLAPRPLIFNGKKYLQPMTFAMDMHLNPMEVKRIVEEGELKNWIVRSLEKPDFYARIEESIASAQGGETGYLERLISSLSMSLDSDAPIRYKDMNLHPEGVGSALAKAMVKKEDLNPFADLFLNSIVINWIKYQTNSLLDVGAIVSKFDSCRMFVRKKSLGFGLERCLYTLNTEARCLSMKLKNYYVLSPEDLMFAYEDMCKNGKEPISFIDRHIAAFLSVKDSKVIDSFIVDLNTEEPHKIVMANLMCFATLQKRSKLPLFPGIAGAMANQLHVVYKRYHDRTVRDALKKNITRYAQEGDLVKMAGLLDNHDVHQKDFVAFKKAMKEYDELKNEAARLELRLSDKKTFGVATGQETSALISSIIAGIIILFVAFLYFSGGPIF